MAIAGLAGLAGLLLQAYLTARLCAARGMDAGATVSTFFSYFTILTNVLIVTNCAICVLAPRSRMAASIARPDVHSGQLLFITIVGSVYITILARLWNPQGLQWWADFLLHYITPGMNLVFWLLFVPKLRMPWTVALRWMIYPLVYFFWVLTRGAITHGLPVSLPQCRQDRLCFRPLKCGLSYITLSFRRFCDYWPKPLACTPKASI